MINNSFINTFLNYAIIAIWAIIIFAIMLILSSIIYQGEFMSEPEIFNIIVVITIIVGFVFLIAVVLFLLYVLVKWLKEIQLEKVIIAALRNSNITFDKIKNIGNELEYQNFNINLLTVLQLVHKKILINKYKNLQEYEQIIDGYIKQCKQEQQYIDIPQNITVCLGQLAIKDINLANTLITEIKVLINKNNRSAKLQKFFTILGALFGLVSLLYAIYVSY